MLGGNYVIASHHPKPWRKQFNILAAYLYFYNPLRFLIALVRPKSKLYAADALTQVLGMNGLLLTIRRTFGWALRLRFGQIKRKSAPPMSPIPMRAVSGAAADHALPLMRTEPAEAGAASGRAAHSSGPMTLPIAAAP